MLRRSLTFYRCLTNNSKVFMQLQRDRSTQINGRHHVPLPSGPYQNIGVRDFMIGFSKRSGFMVRLYYPAEDQSRDIKSQYLCWPNWLPHENYSEGYLDAHGVKSPLVKKFFRWCLGETFLPVISKAKPLQKRMTPIVLSHGATGFRNIHSALCLAYASYGFLVAAVEHRDGTACCTFYPKELTMPMSSSTMDVSAPDGPLKYEDDEDDGFDEIDDPNYVPPRALANSAILPHATTEWMGYRNLKDGSYEMRNKQINRRVKECIRALDLFEALEAGYEVQNLLDPLLYPSEFEGLIDLDKTVVMGHSYGGSTAIMALAAELRFKVGICLDAWMYPIYREDFDLVTQPILFLNSETFSTKSNLVSIKKVLEQSKRTFISCTDSSGNTNESCKGDVDSSKLDDGEKVSMNNGNLLPELNDRGTSQTDSVPNERALITIKGTNHFNQTDVPFTMPWLPRACIGANSSLDFFTALDLNTALTLEFLNKHLKLDILDAKMSDFLETHRKLLKEGIKDDN